MQRPRNFAIAKDGSQIILSERDYQEIFYDHDPQTQASANESHPSPRYRNYTFRSPQAGMDSASSAGESVLHPGMERHASEYTIYATNRHGEQQQQSDMACYEQIPSNPYESPRESPWSPVSPSTYSSYSYPPRSPPIYSSSPQNSFTPFLLTSPEPGTYNSYNLNTYEAHMLPFAQPSPPAHSPSSRRGSVVSALNQSHPMSSVGGPIFSSPTPYGLGSTSPYSTNESSPFSSHNGYTSPRRSQTYTESRSPSCASSSTLKSNLFSAPSTPASPARSPLI
ncbi:hypothetical protein F5050DRAFT_1806577 [Lentinula boryana]|uniref:Uncharacterized protein n=1 Tax=Lentinula boryana TaxID=40481 RepID=A0ABQ8QGV7_9AGAR|nr:hypothetical protein F5050DRAFT_1806577 [Lentinula boryana]